MDIEDKEQDKLSAAADEWDKLTDEQKQAHKDSYLKDIEDHFKEQEREREEWKEKQFKRYGLDQQQQPVEALPEQEKNRILYLANKTIGKFTFKTMRDSGEIYCYDEDKKMYVPNGKTMIEEYCQILYLQVSTHEVNEVINNISRRTRINREEFDNAFTTINFDNGLLDINTLELKDHSPDCLSLVRIPRIYCPACKCPKILKFFGQVLKPKDIFTTLEFFGYCLIRSSKYHRALLCVGKGSNGKSTFLELLDRFVGKINASHVSLQDLGADRFASASLYGKLVNTFADLKDDKVRNTGVFKMLASGDPIRAQRKYGQPFEFQNHAKMVFSANDLPETEDHGYAYFRRLIMFYLENVFEGNNCNPNLIDELSTEEELSGLLNLALIGLKQLIKDNGFNYVDDIAQVKRDYEYNSNMVAQFLAEYCDVAPNGDKQDDKVICSVLHYWYKNFCHDNNKQAKDNNIFGVELRGFGIEHRQARINGVQEWCYFGVKFKQKYLQ